MGTFRLLRPIERILRLSRVQYLDLSPALHALNHPRRYSKQYIHREKLRHEPRGSFLQIAQPS